MKHDIDDFVIPVGKEQAFIDSLKSNFSVAGLVDFANRECGAQLSEDSVQANLARALQEENNPGVTFCRDGASNLIEIPLDDDTLEQVAGGGGTLTININVLASVNAAAAVTVYSAVVAGVVVVVAAGVLVLVAGSGGGFCCFPKHTRVKRADGAIVPIELIPVGTELAALGGSNRVSELVTCVVQPGDKIYQLNSQIECTWEQLFLCEDGLWLAVDLEGYRAYRTWKRKLNPEFGLEDRQFRQMELGDKIYLADGIGTVSSLTYRVVSEPETLHSFLLDGNQSFIANSYVVESGVSVDGADLCGKMSVAELSG